MMGLCVIGIRASDHVVVIVTVIITARIWSARKQAIPRFVPGTLLNQCRLHKTKKHTHTLVALFNYSRYILALAHHSSLTRVRAAPLSPVVGQSNFDRLGRLTTLQREGERERASESLRESECARARAVEVNIRPFSSSFPSL